VRLWRCAGNTWANGRSPYTPRRRGDVGACACSRRWARILERGAAHGRRPSTNSCSELERGAVDARGVRVVVEPSAARTQGHGRYASRAAAAPSAAQRKPPGCPTRRRTPCGTRSVRCCCALAGMGSLALQAEALCRTRTGAPFLTIEVRPCLRTRRSKRESLLTRRNPVLASGRIHRQCRKPPVPRGYLDVVDVGRDPRPR